MSKIIPVDPTQNSYADNLGYKVVAEQNVDFEGRTVTKITYRDAHSLVYKIGQVVLAALITLATLGIALCIPKHRIFWKDTLLLFKDRIVYQNVVELIAIPSPIPVNNKSLNASAVVSTPKENPVSIQKNALSLVTQPALAPTPTLTQNPINVPVLPATAVENPLPLPAVVQTIQLNPAEIELKKLLKENPEYEKAVQAWKNAGVSTIDQKARLEELRKYAFGNDKWVKYFGEIIGSVPSLPDDIYQGFFMDDPSKPCKKVKDTHVLVLIPQAVTYNGKRVDITLTSLGDMAKAPNGGGNAASYDKATYNVNSFNEIKAASTHWALMKTESIPGSRTQTYEKQLEMVAEYSKKVGIDYNMPNAIDAAACCLMTFVSTGERIFDTHGPERFVYTRCQERDKDKALVVGGFCRTNGLGVMYYGNNISDMAVTAMRTL